MHKLAEIVFDQDLELIPNYIDDDSPENTNPAIWYLGKSIEMIAGADYFICFDTSLVNDVFKGCELERQVADTYGIKSFCIRDKIMEMYILGDIAGIAMKIEHSETQYWCDGLPGYDLPIQPYTTTPVLYNGNE